MEPSDYLKPCLPMVHSTQAKMFRDGRGRVLKDMRGGNLDKIRQEWEMQTEVYRSCQRTAKPIQLAGPFFIMEDLGTSDPITDLDELFREGDLLLAGLQQANVLHGDLRPGNIIIKKNRPLAIDFGWAKWKTEKFHFDASLLGSTLYQMWGAQNA